MKSAEPPRRWLARHPAIAAWLLVSGACVLVLAVVTRDLAVAAAGPLLAAAVLGFALAFEPIPLPLTRDGMPMSLPPLRRVARHRDLNPFYVERIVMQSPLRPQACAEAIRDALLGAPWLPTPTRRFIGLVRPDRMRVRRVTWWADGGRPTALIRLEDARPGTLLITDVGAPLLLGCLLILLSLAFIGGAAAAAASGLMWAAARGSEAVVLVLALISAIGALSLAAFVAINRLRIPGSSTMSEADHVVAFLDDVVGANVVARD